MDLDTVDVERFEAGRFGDLRLQKIGDLVSLVTSGFAGVLHSGFAGWRAARRDWFRAISAQFFGDGGWFVRGGVPAHSGAVSMWK